jgi:hypothetical protein
MHAMMEAAELILKSLSAASTNGISVLLVDQRVDSKHGS